jgi:kinesin family member C1
MAFSQSTTTRPLHSARPQTSMASKRPASSMDDHMETGGGPVDGKRKGMTPFPRSSTSSPIQSPKEFATLQYKKVRSRHSMRSLQILQESTSLREVSVTTALSKLRLDDSSSANELPISSRIPKATPGSIRVSKSSNLAAVRKSKIDNSSGTLVVFQNGARSLVTPSTPSQIQILSRAEAPCATPVTPSRVFKSSTTKTQFLTKDSNIPAFVAWDVRGRLEDMEAMYFELKDTLTGTSMERNGLEEAVAKFKAKCMLSQSRRLLSIIFLLNYDLKQ